MILKNCLYCGTEFSSHIWQKKIFCKHPCFCAFSADKRRQNKRLVLCIYCDTPFEIGWTGDKRRPGTKYCSNVCRYQILSNFNRKGGTECLILSEVDAAYLAGIMDGEGTICLKRKPNGSVFLNATFTNTYKPLLEWTMKKTGLGMIYKKPPKNLYKHKVAYIWGIRGLAVASFLTQIQPYVRIKKSQLEIALAAHSRIISHIYEGDRTWQQKFFDEMTALNKRGPKAA